MLQTVTIMALILEALLYWLLAITLLRRGIPWYVIAPLIGAIALAWRLLLSLPSYLLASWLGWRDARRGVVVPRAPGALKALAKEFDARSLGYTVTQPFHQLFMRVEPAGRPTGVPVLLVHGYLCNRGIWWAFRRGLAAAGVGPVYSITLAPVWGRIDAMLAGFEQRINDICTQTGQQKIIIVAHSMGGLVTRAYVARSPANAARIAQVITLGSPHHGTRMALAGPAQCVDEMRVGSAWLAALEQAEVGVAHPPTTSIYTLNDDLVYPPESSQIAWGDNIVLNGVGHVGMMFSKPVIARVVALIRR